MNVAAPFFRRGTTVAALALLALSLRADPALPADNPSAAAAKPYSLYLGADFSVEWQGKQRPVLDVQGSTFIVDVDGKRVAVPTRKGLAMKIDRALKVAPVGLAVTKFDAERAYTAQNDPKRWYGVASSNMAGAIGVTDGRAHDLTQAEMRVTVAGSDMAAAQKDVDTARAAYQDSFAEVGDAMSALADLTSRAGAESAQGRFDAFSLTFDISSPKPIGGLYLVVVTFLREDANDPKSLKQWIYAQQIDPIGPKPATFRLFRGGFPPGYQLVATQIHLYQAGVELDTSIAPKRVEISADDAFQFKVADYVSQRRGSTLPATAVSVGLPKHLRTSLTAAELSRTYYLRISKSGTPLGAFMDRACTDRIDGTPLSAALMAMRFYPALQAGKPIESLIDLRL